MTTITPTAEQADIIDAFVFGADLVIEAGAGTGKTSTLKLLAKAANAGERGVYIAYNKSIASQAAKAFPSSVTCKTAHGFAYAAVGKHYAHRLSGPRVPAQRTAQILGITQPVKIGEVRLAPQTLARLVTETVARWCYSADATIDTGHVPYVTGLDRPGQTELARYIAPIAQRAWDTDLSNTAGQLRYTHDHYLKAWTLTAPQLSADYVLLDEAQDSNGCVAGLVTGQQAQRIWVGDRSQSIYGWRGAVDAMEHAPGMRLYLSQSFRFGPAVAGEANKWLSILDAPLRLTGFDKIPSRVERCATPDAVLCRTNAGALGQVIAASEAGRKPALVGGGGDIRRFAEGAQQLQQTGYTDHPDLCAFSSWFEVRVYSQEEGDGSDLRVMVALVDQHTARGVIALVDSLTDEARADVVVSTAHKAKGREWPAVRIAGDFAEPKGDDDPARDECMLAYVAVTRAQRVLDRDGLDWVDRFAADGWHTRLPDPWTETATPTSVPAEPVLSVTHDPCTSCGYLPDFDGICRTCPTSPTSVSAAEPYPVHTEVCFRDTAAPAVYLVTHVHASLIGGGWIYELRQGDGRVRRGIRSEAIQPYVPEAVAAGV